MEQKTAIPDKDRTIPLVIGVAGHRALREEDYDALYGAVKAELVRIRGKYPHSPLVMLSSLAEGADLLCAEAAYELEIPILAALPMPSDKYEEDFSPAAKERFAFHKEKAGAVFITPATEKVPDTGMSRDFLFRQAGIYVVSHCHILLALWDGGPGTAAACGTAEAVDSALSGSYTPVSGLPVRSGSNTGVLHIYTPRGERCEEAAGTVHFLGDREAAEEILARTDAFNREAAAGCPETKTRFPEEGLPDPKLRRMEAAGTAAGQISSENAKRYRTVLALLAGASMIITFAFLMYDEAEAIWMILVCGAVLALAWLCQRYAEKSDCHRKYIEYRALSECLWVQMYLRYAGSSVEASSLLTWTQQEETAWILDALCALSAGPPPNCCHSVRECWVEGQKKYHRWAGSRSMHALRVSENVVRSALAVSVILYLAAVLFEVFCGGMLRVPVLHVADADWYRTALKILLGTISALTLFISNYYGRLSLTRTLSDHQKMEKFYDRMAQQMEKRGQTEELLTLLAREELVENGNWCSYQRDNTPDLSL